LRFVNNIVVKIPDNF